MKPSTAAAVLLLLFSVPALAADKPKPEPPDAKFLAAVDKAIASAQDKAVPTPKLLKLAKALIKKGRLIRANEVAALIARKGTDADQATAKKINGAVARFKGIVGSWNFGSGRRHFTPDGRIRTDTGDYGKWSSAGNGVYEFRNRTYRFRGSVSGMNLNAVYTNATHNAEWAGKPYNGKRVK